MPNSTEGASYTGLQMRGDLHAPAIVESVVASTVDRVGFRLCRVRFLEARSHNTADGPDGHRLNSCRLKSELVQLARPFTGASFWNLFLNLKPFQDSRLGSEQAVDSSPGPYPECSTSNPTDFST